MKERKRMTIRVEGGEQSMKERKHVTIKAEGRTENDREKAYDHKSRGESRE
jgi:hypothetical protein